MIKLSLFQSLVGRRIFLLFILCALIPVTALMVISLKQVYDYTTQEHRVQLRHVAKTAGLTIHEGLYLLQSELESKARSFTVGASPGTAVNTSHFVSIGLVTNGTIHPLTGSPITIPSLATLEPLPHRDTNQGSVLIKTRDQAGTHLFLLMIAPAGQESRPRAIGEINQHYLWELVQQTIPPHMELTVLSRESEWQPIYASESFTPNRELIQAVTAESGRTSNGHLIWGSGDSAISTAFWTVHLKPTLSADSWLVVVTQSRGILLQPIKLFLHTFGLIIVLTLLIVAFISVKQIRRSLVPLLALQEGTRQISQGNLGVSIAIDSKDEFEELGGAFNAMSRNLAEHFAENRRLITELEDLNWGTIHALAKTVDAKSPWTAGHSERVTRIALELGKRMGLDEQKLEHLKIGGLFHDIGKIGISEALLDKAGKLTDEEYALVREHPAKGEAILKPIRAYQEIIPIVAQHHECFDGSGYPYGLAGEEISPGARIMAVADVFDALFSHRPYRQGWELSAVMEFITSKAGSQFDPEVITALTGLWHSTLQGMTPEELEEYRGGF